MPETSNVFLSVPLLDKLDLHVGYSMNAKSKSPLNPRVSPVFFRAVVGEVDEDLDSRVDFENLRAEPLNPVIY